jgi:hypothetical protein
VALGALAIGAGLYANALRISGEPLLRQCWPVELVDQATGQKVVGAEDMDFDPASGTIFISAYNRRAVAGERHAGDVTTQGGIYTLSLAALTPRAALPVIDRTEAFRAGHDFRPHGFAFGRDAEGAWLWVINRLYEPADGRLAPRPVFETFRLAPEGWLHAETRDIAGMCDPYDVAMLPGREGGFAFTDVTRRCDGGWFATRGALWLSDGAPRALAEGLAFPNGIAVVGERLLVAETRGHALAVFDLSGRSAGKDIPLPIGPDNLTADGDGVLVAGFPNLLDYYFYLQGWLGIRKTPSAAYRLSLKGGMLALLFKDDGALISGATVALRAGNYLLLGSAWDDHVAVCSGMGGIS